MTSYLQVLKYLQESQTELSFSEERDQTLITGQKKDNNLQKQIYCQDLPSYSFIQYVPFKRSVIDIKEKVYTQRIPKIKKVNYQMERVFVENVPRQRTETDYYAVQHLRYYQKQTVPQKTIQYVPVVRTIKKIEMVPVQRKIIHYPKDIEINNFIEGQDKSTIIEKPVTYSDISQRSSLLREYSPRTVERQFSPIKEFYPEESDIQNDQVNQNVSTSILQSLSKAYSPQPSTDQGEYSPQNNFKIPVSPFQFTRYKPSTLQQVNYKSTQTIDSKYLMNL